MNDWFVYILLDRVSGRSFYVGQTNDPKRRERGHCTSKKQARWRRLGFDPELVVVEGPMSRAECYKREHHWIHELLWPGCTILVDRAFEHGPLFNRAGLSIDELEVLAA